MHDVIAKIDIISACNQLLNDRATRLQQAIDDARDAALGETKSSAGDKYETGREMMLAEAERLSTQLADVEKMRKGLYNAANASSSSSIGLGSLVKTNAGFYFLAIGLGKVEVEEHTVYVISPASPIGQLFMGKIAGEEITFAGKTQQILAVG